MKNTLNQISNLKIQNFKSIKKAHLDCKRINLFIGKPNVGKSNILEALSLFCAPQSQKYEKHLSDFIRYEKLSNLFYDQNLNNTISVTSNIGVAYLRYHMNQLDMFDIIIGMDEDILNNLVSNKPQTIRAIQEIFENYVNNNRTHQELLEFTTVKPFYKALSPDGKEQAGINAITYNSPVKKYEFKKLNEHKNHFPSYLLPPYGENLFTMLQSNSEFYDKITHFYNEFGLDLLLDVENNKLDIQKRVGNKVYKIPYSLTADTLQRIIFHLSAIETNKGSIILFEEPEAHSYPPYINTLAEKIIESKTNQFFIATHSPYILIPFMQQCSYKDVAIFIATYENYETKVRELTEKEIENIVENDIDLFFNLKAFSK